MSFHTIKTYSVVDKAENVQDLITKKQQRVDNNLGTSAHEPQDVYTPIGQLIVKEIEEAPAPIKVGDVYKTQDGSNCRIVATDRKGMFPVVGLLSGNPSSIEIVCYYSPDGTCSLGIGRSEMNLVLPSTRRKMVVFAPYIQRKDPWETGHPLC